MPAAPLRRPLSPLLPETRPPHVRRLPLAVSLALLPLAWPVDAATTPRVEAPAAVRALSSAFAETVRAVRPSVVRVDVVYRLTAGGLRVAPAAAGSGAAPAPPQPSSAPSTLTPPSGSAPPRLRGHGSGVVVDDRGYVITSRHVVHGAARVTVTLHDARRLAAEVVGEDRRTDLALLRLPDAPVDLMAARLGQTAAIEVGEWVLALGCPLGLAQTATVGILGGKGLVGRRMGMSGDQVREYLQTDARINPGNSGGPLVNLAGEVVGINTLIRGGAGGTYGFALPVEEVRRVTAALLSGRKVRLPYLGAEPATGLAEARTESPPGVEAAEIRVKARPAAAGPAPAAAARGRSTPSPGAGVVVGEVAPDGPAARAGLRVGDVIVAMAGNEILFAEELRAVVAARAIGEAVPIDYLRDGHPARTRVTLGPPPEDARRPRLQ